MAESNRKSILNIVFVLALLLVGAACFAVAGYSYWAMIEMYESLKSYGLEDQYYSHERIGKTVNSLRFGVIQYSLSGIVFVAASAITLIRRRRLTKSIANS